MIPLFVSLLYKNPFLPSILNSWLPVLVLLLVGLVLRWAMSFKASKKPADKRMPSAPISAAPPDPAIASMFPTLRRPWPPVVKHQDIRAPAARRLSTPIEKAPVSPKPLDPRTKQPYDAFLVLDVEGTCNLGTDFSYPNEIIEFPVCLMRWKDRSSGKKASQLEVVDEFRSFVKPTWRPILSQFCMDLTGITQTQVDSAPLFVDVLKAFSEFLVKNQLIDSVTGERRARFCWCTDGPYDIRDFVIKQCFISKISMPEWLQGDVLDVRMMSSAWAVSNRQEQQIYTRPSYSGRMPSLNIPSQLRALGLAPFEGRQHSGIDDARNIARILAALAAKGERLRPNTAIRTDRRWQWMGKHGEILEEYCLI